MADHLLIAEIARSVIRKSRREFGLTLAVDRGLASPLIDIDDATKVETAPGGAIVRIGKALPRFDAIDTGVFFATPALAAALREDIAGGGGGSLSDAVQRLADRGKAQSVDVTGCFWLDVDDSRALTHAETITANLRGISA